MAYKIAQCGGLRYNTTDFKEISGVITLASNSVLSGTPFVASMCGGVKFDGGVFKSAKVNGKDVITNVNETPDSYLRANCSLLFDADIFEIGEDDELSLVPPPAPSGVHITWDGVTTGKQYIEFQVPGIPYSSTLYHVSDEVLLTDEEIIGAKYTLDIDGEKTTDAVVSTLYSEDDKFVMFDGNMMIFSGKAGEHPLVYVEGMEPMTVTVPADGTYFLYQEGQFVCDFDNRDL